MKGAAVLPPKTINIPIINNMMIIGASQYFFRAFINSHKSFKNSIYLSLIILKILEAIISLPFSVI